MNIYNFCDFQAVFTKTKGIAASPNKTNNLKSGSIVLSPIKGGFKVNVLTKSNGLSKPVSTVIHLFVLLDLCMKFLFC